MPSTYNCLTYHLVFSTKHRAPLITYEVREPLYRYLGGILRSESGTLIEIGGVQDHVHLLAQLKTTQAVADILRVLKCNSSKWINDGALLRERFAWQTGYSAFTVSNSQIDTVRRYLNRQAEHHKQTTYRDEVEALCRKHGVEFDAEHFDE
ncbi:Transposase IS200 like protein [Posidoniimonas corsicana]|uniref:Transposase IS200 like protein n=1 Tax=Posidoniimonas corsicana TaxID=1938618 RepID=A0A5C5VHW7_9BACT|nr:IS200/IS605 family transposase [Posidoniimonas corsicana]TWT37577.1 Transposase IS200 like protein [Posidoniimonas corsicana]